MNRGAKAPLLHLLENPAIWRGASQASVPAIATGWAELDAALPGGGWPCGALTELFVDAYGIGELTLLLPALTRIAEAGQPQVWIAPPMVPYAPALAGAGLDLTQLLIVQPPVEQQAWTAEECLRVDGCGAVLAWLPALDHRRLRRLQLAAAASGACGFLFSPGASRCHPSPAALRIGVAANGESLEITVYKARGVSGSRSNESVALRLPSARSFTDEGGS
ncbi:MAG: translesion DNA synthesis-associated protein ImuA [Gammaproteobacteria bacterium]